MARPKKQENERLVLQPLRISPLAKSRLASVTTSEKKQIISEMRKAVERIIIAMTDKTLQGEPKKIHFR